jgi:hypothetical protein
MQPERLSQKPVVVNVYCHDITGNILPVCWQHNNPKSQPPTQKSLALILY